ncbi:MAG: basic secretory protein-like protein [Thermoguttaceae bacterium]
MTLSSVAGWHAQSGLARRGDRRLHPLVPVRAPLLAPASRSRAKYTDSYRTAGAFLDYVVRARDKEIVKKLNAAMRQGRYAPELWKTYTGKTVDELWAEYVKTLPAR